MSKRQQDITDEQFKKLLREISKRFAIAGGVVIPCSEWPSSHLLTFWEEPTNAHPQRPNGDIFNRMVSGAAYMPDAECAAQTKRIHAATVPPKNTTHAASRHRYSIVYREHLGHLGEHSHIRPGARFDYGVNTYIGDGSFFNFGCVFLDVCPIRIGSTVLVGNNVQFPHPTHPLNPVDRAAYWEGGGAHHR